MSRPDYTRLEIATKVKYTSVGPIPSPTPPPPVMVDITITTDPELNGSVTVDAVTYDAPHTFSWAVGSNHTITAISPVSGYAFSSWSDAGAQTHVVHILGPDTVTASYTLMAPMIWPQIGHKSESNGQSPDQAGASAGTVDWTAVV